MKRPRFTIAGLLVLILFLGVGLAALRGATDEWDSGVFGVTLALLLVSVLLAAHRTGDRRAYWLGFALFGGAYLLLSLVPPIESRLPTTRALAYLDSKVSDRAVSFTVAYTSSAPGGPANSVQTFAFAPSGSTMSTSTAGAVRLWNLSTGRAVSGPGGSQQSFLRIGHSLLVFVLAIVGAHVSRYLHDSGKAGLAGETLIDRTEAIPSPPDGDFEANTTK